MITTVNPADGQTLAAYPTLPAREVGEALDWQGEAARGWAAASVDERCAALGRMATRLRAEKARLARLMALEMGKPVAQGEAECEKCAWVCEYFAAAAPRLLAEQVIRAEGLNTRLVPEPVGIIFAIMPWNFPFWQFFRATAGALAAGNAVVLKHAPNTTGCGLAIERLLAEAGMPAGVVQTLVIDVDLAPVVIAHPAVRGVTLTGSGKAGAAVAAEAGRRLKKTVLELGGSDPYLVLDDADIDLAARALARSRLLNAGQVCIAAKRLIVVDAVREAFTKSLMDALQEWQLGDPLDSATTLGPMARMDLRDAVHDQVERSRQAGARLRLGGEVPRRPGSWYPVTLLDGVRPGMAAFDEEVFGPVAVIVPARDEGEAIGLANTSCYGLGGGVFTGDHERGQRVARALRVGACAVNAVVQSDPRVPFGGVKDSGYGRELGDYGIQEFMTLKSITTG